jgi:hypothetical protein
MAIVCIQCSMRALLADEPSPKFDETPEEHFRTHHSDPVATQKERQELERRWPELERKLDQLERKKAGEKNIRSH